LTEGVEGKVGLLLVGTGSHIDGDELELEIFLVKSSEDAIVAVDMGTP
jgi:hypothetical protein